MRKDTLVLVATLSAVLTGIADAQDRGRERRPGPAASSGAAPTSGAARPLPADPVKRTWDFTKRFGIINLGGRGGCGADEQKALAQIQASEKLVAEFLAGPGDPKKLKLERRNYLRQVNSAEASLATYQADYLAVGKRSVDAYVPPLDADICLARGLRLSVQAIRVGLDGIARVYPDMPEAAAALARADAVLKAMGNDKTLSAMVQANRNATLAGVRLKPALSNNPEWIGGFRGAFPRLVPGVTVLKVHPYSSAWYVHRNPVTSVPEYRQIGAWIAVRRGDGSCWIYGIDLWQNYTGSGFDSGEYKLGDPPRQILCDKV